MHRQNGSTALCAIRSNLKQEAAELVANYTYLSSVESAFRRMKTISLQVRPIYHRNKTWEIVHVFCLCWLTMWRISVPKAGTGAVCPSGGKAQRKNAVEVADLKAKKKARTRHNEEDKRYRYESPI